MTIREPTEDKYCRRTGLRSAGPGRVDHPSLDAMCASEVRLLVVKPVHSRSQTVSTSTGQPTGGGPTSEFGPPAGGSVSAVCGRALSMAGKRGWGVGIDGGVG